MRYYMAPLEGITGYVFRNAYHRHFTPFDKYFTPFVAPTRKASLSTKEKNDVLPEHNKGLQVVPQILSNNATLFIMCAKKLYQESGYSEVNLNLGCPSGTVVSKGKGAGFLGRIDALEAFLDEIYSEQDMPAISIKTRLGMEDIEEFVRILAIFNRYPLAELIVHPRLQKELYRGSVHTDSYAYAAEHARASLCYNGDVFDAESYQRIRTLFPDTSCVMLGRGILQNPFLLENLRQMDPQFCGSDKNKEEKSFRDSGSLGEIKGCSVSDRNRLRDFHDDILAGYIEIMPGEMPVLFKMKELWIYLQASMEFGSDRDRIEKRIKKAGTISEYRSVMETVFTYPLKG